jgi:adenine-specific DNA methylase
MEWFREKIREAYGGRAPRVLDPFAGGGAIPLEAMRLGCEATAIDINPVAWFILKCTLAYPQELAAEKRPLPDFALRSPDFMAEFQKTTSGRTKTAKQRAGATGQTQLLDGEHAGEADLAWHVRAWGWWVLQQARAKLARFHSVTDGKPTVASLWARTVKCKSCRATLPLIKTRWLCRRDRKRVVLLMKPRPDGSGVSFAIRTDVPGPPAGVNQKKHDRTLGQGTMSRSGAKCPICNVIMTMEDIRIEGRAGRLGSTMTAVVVDGTKGKEYRLPDDADLRAAVDAESMVPSVFADIPFGLPDEELPRAGALGFRAPLYGIDRWSKLFTPRQVLSLGVFARVTRLARSEMRTCGYPSTWVEALSAYLAAMLDRLANQNSTGTMWNTVGEKVEQTFARFALPIHWDFPESNPVGDLTGGYRSALDWVSLVVSHVLEATGSSPTGTAIRGSAIARRTGDFDVVVTDPPYYDAIPYSDLMDFFYVWLRRVLQTGEPGLGDEFENPLGPKWSRDRRDGELIDDASRFDNDGNESRAAYEDGMSRAFENCRQVLRPGGRLVVVFANKQPKAWDALVSATIKSGFTVVGSWPIATERSGGVRNLNRASLSSSVWLVCRVRGEDAKPGWDNLVLDGMREQVHLRLRDFWDAGIRGPDFVWAATGPALEAYSKHPVVKKADKPGEVMTVPEFLRHVRRLVVDYVVGRVLAGGGESDAASSLDDVTAYYLLHRYDFRMEDAPAGACILYAVSCGLSDRELTDRHDLLVWKGGSSAEEDDEDDDEDGNEDADGEERSEERSGSKARLKPWNRRGRKTMGYDSENRPAPIIDQIHRLMQLWKSGDEVRVNEYIEERTLAKNSLFLQVLQAVVELAQPGSEERSILESIMKHVGGHAPSTGRAQQKLDYGPEGADG